MMEQLEYYNMPLEETIAASMLRAYADDLQIPASEIGKRFLRIQDDEVQINGDSLINLMIEARDYLLRNIKSSWLDNKNMDKQDLEKYIHPVIVAVAGIDFITLVNEMSPEFIEYLCEYAGQ